MRLPLPFILVHTLALGACVDVGANGTAPKAPHIANPLSKPWELQTSTGKNFTMQVGTEGDLQTLETWCARWQELSDVSGWLALFGQRPAVPVKIFRAGALERSILLFRSDGGSRYFVVTLDVSSTEGNSPGLQNCVGKPSIDLQGLLVSVAELIRDVTKEVYTRDLLKFAERLDTAFMSAEPVMAPQAKAKHTAAFVEEVENMLGSWPAEAPALSEDDCEEPGDDPVTWSGRFDKALAGARHFALVKQRDTLGLVVVAKTGSSDPPDHHLRTYRLTLQDTGKKVSLEMQADMKLELPPHNELGAVSQRGFTILCFDMTAEPASNVSIGLLRVEHASLDDPKQDKWKSLGDVPAGEQVVHFSLNVHAPKNETDERTLAGIVVTEKTEPSDLFIRKVTSRGVNRGTVSRTFELRNHFFSHYFRQTRKGFLFVSGKNGSNTSPSVKAYRLEDKNTQRTSTSGGTFAFWGSPPAEGGRGGLFILPHGTSDPVRYLPWTLLEPLDLSNAKELPEAWKDVPRMSPLWRLPPSSAGKYLAQVTITGAKAEERTLHITNICP